MNIEQSKFPPQKSLPKIKAKADGMCFKGFSVVSKNKGNNVCIVAADIETLKNAYMAVSGCELDVDGVQDVAIFHQSNITEQP